MAQNLLINHFQRSLDMRRDLVTLRLFCQESSSQSENVKKLLMRILKRETGHLIVDIILNDVEEKMRRLVIFRYQKNLSLLDISLKLNISLSQLNKWNYNICKQIYDYMQYHLSKQDVYSRKKIVNMVEILGQEITMIDTTDPERRFVDENYYNGLNVRFQKYTRLLEHLDFYMCHHKRGERSDIIFQKICNPNIKIEELAKLCAYSVTQVSRQLHDYQMEVCPYVY